MNAAEPWENLRFLKKVEVLPGAGCNALNVSLDEDYEYGEFTLGGSCLREVTSINRRLMLGNATVQYHWDYPDDFKRLVYHFGDKVKAYHAYNALQRPVPEKWDICDKDGEFDCDC